ncbi:hypothetical protein [Flexivirga oryzae]|uniref:Uncharacterized protein n=1 Tax=Flexivirga oryzae TaxID=1794944 RepID=A0A839N0S3_9MICO|nr:hypothetical protein [Flexivirga oryzae]MBB2890967.1 hypothetical protein [Flexivirga oryzae]
MPDRNLEELLEELKEPSAADRGPDGSHHFVADEDELLDEE